MPDGVLTASAEHMHPFRMSAWRIDRGCRSVSLTLGFLGVLGLPSPLIGCAATPGDQGESDAGSSTTTAATTSSTGPAMTTLEATSAGSASDTSTGATTDATTDATTGVTPTPDDCITEVTAGHHTFDCDGLVYDIEVPDVCLAQPCGMIFDVHGYTMSAQMQDANTGMRALGQEYGFIVVQPNANPAPPASSWVPAVDDDKVFDFMQRVAAAWDVDPDRWHFTGFSQGGFMSWRFVCDHADVLASVAPGAACGNGVPFPDCRFVDGEVPSEPIDILYLHGSSDALVSFACAQPRVDAVVEFFGLGAAEMVEQDETHTWVRHSNDEMVLEFIAHDYSAAVAIIRGHCFPGSTDPGDAPGQFFSFACEPPNAFVWGAAVMQFFVDHPR